MKLNKIKKSQKKAGLDFNPDIEIIRNTKKESQIIKQIEKGILLFLCTWGTIGSFTSALDILVSDKIYIAIFIITIFLTFIYCFSKYLFFIYIGIDIFYLIGILMNLNQLKEGIFAIGNSFVEKANIYFDVNYIFQYTIAPDGGKSVTTFLIFFLIGFMQIIIYMIFYQKSKIFYLILTLPFVLIGFMIGLVPDVISLAFYLIATITILGDKTLSGEIILISIGTFLFLGITIFFTKEDYSERVHIEKTKQQIQEVMRGTRNISIPILNQLPFLGGQAVGGLSAGKIGKVDAVTFRNKIMLQVSMASDSALSMPVYLKGFVGSNYGGNNWTGLSKEDQRRYDDLQKEFEEKGFCIENSKEALLNEIENNDEMRREQSVYSYYAQARFLGKIKIKNVEIEGKYTFVPYSIKDSIELTKKGKIQLKRKLSKDESLIYHVYLDEIVKRKIFFELYKGDYSEKEDSYLPAGSEYSILEKKYRDFVYDVYTRLPEDKATETIKTIRLFGSLNGENLADSGILEKIANVQRYLEENTDYTLEPGKVPEGKDFVDYFLFESRKGYCSYYATAATVMLRALGVPTRYVEGFIVTQKDVERGIITNKNQEVLWTQNFGVRMNTSTLNVNIRDNNAHAWIEVYMDGYGWVPIEVTKGYIFNNEIIVPGTNEDKKESSKTNIANSQTGNQKSVLKGKSVPTATPSVKKTEKKDSIDGLLWIKLVQVIFFIFLCIICILLIRRWFILMLKKKKYSISNDKNKILTVFQEINHMLEYYQSAYHDEAYEEYSSLVVKRVPFVKEEDFIKYMQIILKFRFAENYNSIEEYQWIQNYYKEFQEQMYQNAGNWWKKIYYKYIKVY